MNLYDKLQDDDKSNGIKLIMSSRLICLKCSNNNCHRNDLITDFDKILPDAAYQHICNIMPNNMQLWCYLNFGIAVNNLVVSYFECMWVCVCVWVDKRMLLTKI